MAPVTFTRPAGTPRYPLAVIDPKVNLKGQIMSVLEAHGVTCDQILLIMDEVKADRSKLGDYFTLG
ncbi:MAG: hypothetical protein ACFCVC_02115 [Acidimicrobiia bacterium]